MSAISRLRSDFCTARTEPAPWRGQAPFRREGTRSLLLEGAGHPRLDELSKDLVASDKAKRAAAMLRLLEYMSSAEKARDVLGILPPEDSRFSELGKTRSRCIAIIREGLK